MKRIRNFLLSAALFTSPMSFADSPNVVVIPEGEVGSSSVGDQNDEFEPIFDGETFDGWKHNGNWVIEGDAVYRNASGGPLTYTAANVPDDFELRFEWKVSKGCNSGVYYRPGQVEYQVLDNVGSPYGENARQSAASLFFCMAPKADATRPLGKWNTARVICQGAVIEHWLNEQRVLSFDYSDPQWSEYVELLATRGGDLTGRGGQLWLQDHGQDVWFRNLRWRPIPQDEIILPDPNFQPQPVTGTALKKERARVQKMVQAKAKQQPLDTAADIIIKPLSFGDVNCEGVYRHHLQGVCTDNEAAIYWSFTTQLVKTDRDGRVLHQIPVANHHGDLCFDDGMIFVAVNLGRFNDPQGNADSWVYVYDAKSLDLLAKHEIQNAIYGAGGIGIMQKHFYVVGGLPNGVEENDVYEYDAEFTLVRKHVIDSNWTQMGIQTATFHEGDWWFGCYGSPAVLLKTDADFKLLGRYEFNASLGIIGVGRDRLLVAQGSRNPVGRFTGSLHLARPDENRGLAVIQP